MPAVTNERGDKTFLNIVAGRIVEQVEEGTVGAVSRVNKLGRTVFEKTHDAWGGIVRDWKIEEFEYEGKKMKTLKVLFDDASLSLSGGMMREFINKFAGADKMQPIVISPYPDFIGKDGRPKKSGLTLIQDSERIYSHFSDYNKETNTHTAINGFPVAPARWDAMTEEQLAIYKIQVNSFLEKYVTEHPINTIGAGSENAPEPEDLEEKFTNPNDVPF